MHADLAHFIRWVAEGEPSSRLLELPGVTGSIVPAVPDRSVMNSLVYDGVDALERALPEIAAAHAEAGTRAWTVWVTPGDDSARELLARAGNALDASPLAMVCDLDGFEPPSPGDLDWSEGEHLLAEAMAVNDASYRFDGTPFGNALTRAVHGAHVYLARLDGEPASSLVTLERDGSAGVYCVATRPEARGRGLARRLLGRALSAARERGCTVSTLQATTMGAPVYERLGYRAHGTVEMWERRVA